MFEYMITQENPQLELKTTNFKGWQRGHITHEFHYQGRFKFAYILQMEDDILGDIFRYNFSTYEVFKPFLYELDD